MDGVLFQFKIFTRAVIQKHAVSDDEVSDL
jgi:hypothetical protein